jgi:hypothetical protein
MSIRGAVAALGVIAIVGSVGTAVAQPPAEEQAPRKMQIRNYDHLEFDTVTGTYFGIATFYTNDDTVKLNVENPDTGEVTPVGTDNETVTGELRILMGGERFQGGVLIPYHLTSGDAVGPGENDVGNVRAHLKFIPLRRDLFDAGGGLMLIFPGGSESQGISVPNVGVLPFVTGTAHLGPVDLNAHIGYNFYNHNEAQRAPESILYGSTLTYPILDMLGLRLELAGQQFTSGEDRNVIAIQPGLDMVFPLGDDYGLQLSAAGSYGLGGGAAGDAPGYSSRYGLNTLSGLSRGEWGIGAALGFLWY